MSHFIKVADPDPGWRTPFIFGWAGMRGVVSLAAALSIPVLISKDNPFPYRSLILFITFIVILVTLILQGLTLPWMIRKIKPEKEEDKFMTDENQELVIQKRMAESSLKFLEEKYRHEWQNNRHVRLLYEKLKSDLEFFNEDTSMVSDRKDSSFNAYREIYLDLLEHQRKVLNEINLDASYDEEIIRKYSGLIDLEEFNIREKT
jgi:CPA1 family monovalent cation:H+ antiporter